MPTQFEKEITFRPAFDKRSDDPSKNYGIGSLEITFTLKTNKGGVTFQILTGMHLPHVRKEWILEGKDAHTMDILTRGMGAAISYHAVEPTYEGQKKYENACHVTGLDFCYCDSGFMAADDLYHRFLAGGDGPVWAELEGWYWANIEPKKD